MQGHNVGMAWESWHSLEGCWRTGDIPALPGLYRIRRAGRDDLDYIGQTGMGTMHLRKRLAMLVGVYGDVMPYRDPHTAAPGLWALRHSLGCSFEVSVLPVEGDIHRRKGMEALALALYRQEWGISPSINFGRMPIGYQMSSANNRQLAETGRRFHGGPTPDQDASHLPSLPPAGTLGGDPVATTWGGHKWSGWIGLGQSAGTLPERRRGLYRLRTAGEPKLVYIGQGAVGSRLSAHLRNAASANGRQGELLGQAMPLECSWVLDDRWHDHQHLELENDLVAAHVLAVGSAPRAQFLG